MQQEVSTITANSLVFILCMGFLLLVLPRRYALAPFLVSACYMTLGQALIIGGLHFYLIRIIIFIGMIRIFIKKEIFSIKLNSIDKILIAWLIVISFLYVLFSGNYTSFTQRLGNAYNTIGIYFLIRSLVRDFDDIVFTLKMLGIIIIPLAFLFAMEHTSGKNPFSILGGVSVQSEIRNGITRCQGPFLHSILAGTFGATAMPLFVGLWLYSNRSRLAVGAFLASTYIVIASASSGPAMAYLASIVGLICWSFKSHMKTIRWGIAILVLALTVYMNAPVWFLISHISNITGGGGWYRSALIDAAYRHFDEWWLIGTGYTANWMSTGLAIDPNSADMVNYFIEQAVNGGLLALILFIWLIVKCFKTVGVAVRNNARYSTPERLLIWSLGCTVLGHVASFFSVSYFDQLTIFWYLIIAMISVLTRVRNVREPTASNSPNDFILKEKLKFNLKKCVESPRTGTTPLDSVLRVDVRST